MGAAHPCQGLWRGFILRSLRRVVIASLAALVVATHAGDVRGAPSAYPPGDERSAAPAAPAPETSRRGLSLPQDPFASQGKSDPPGDESNGDDDADAPGAPLRALACLEGEGGEAGDGARRGVQKRDFQKRHRFELGLLGGYVAMDALSSTYITGGTLAFYPSEDFGLEVLVSRAPARFRLEEPFTGFDREHHFEPGVAWQGLIAGLFSPFHAKLRFTDKAIWHADLFLLAGAGRTWHGSVQGLSSELGLGVKLYPWRYLGFRVDVRDFIYPQEVLGHASTTHNIAVMAGFSVWGPGGGSG